MFFLLPRYIHKNPVKAKKVITVETTAGAVFRHIIKAGNIPMD
jgi:hypothetical protein